MQGTQRSAKAFDDRLACRRVRRRPRVAEAPAGQAFRDIPRPVRALAMGDMPGVRDFAADEQTDDRGLVAIGATEPLVGVQSYDIFVADPHAAGLNRTFGESVRLLASQRPPAFSAVPDR